MSKNELSKRIEKIESIRPRANGPLVIIKMWCVGGVDPPYDGGRTRIIASNKGESNE
jgi:hypothetical protein